MEAAGLRVLLNLAESPGNRLTAVDVRAETADSGRIDQVATTVEVVKAAGAGGMAAFRVCLGNARNLDVFLRQQPVDQ